MKVLFIGGTGTISSAITRKLIENNEDVYLLNRGNRKSEVPASVNQMTADINDEEDGDKPHGHQRANPAPV